MRRRRARKQSQQMPASRLESVAHLCHTQHLLFIGVGAAERQRKRDRERDEKKGKKFICWYFCCVQLLLERRCRRCRCRCYRCHRCPFSISNNIAHTRCVPGTGSDPVRSLHLHRVRVGAIINSYIMNEQTQRQTY